MSNEKQLSGEDSLAIIHQMIGQAKSNYTETGMSWLLWGVMLFLTSLSTYIFIDIKASDMFLAWNIFGIVSILLLVYHLAKPPKKPVRTYVDDLLKLVSVGFVISMGIIILAINLDAVSPRAGFGFFLMIFAFLMLVRGGAIRSRSLFIGAIVNWAGAIAIMFVKEFKYAMLIMAVAVLIGYIIPGFLLMAENKKANRFPKTN